MNLLKQTRTKLGLTQTQMAEVLGYSGKKDISRIETGKRAETPQLKKHLELLYAYHELTIAPSD